MVHEGMHAISLIHHLRHSHHLAMMPLPLLFIVCLFAPMLAADDDPPEVVRIALQDRSVQALLRWAEARGDFAQENVQPELSLVDPDSIDRIADGTLDLIAGSAETLLQASSDGFDLRGVLVLGWSLKADAIMGGAGVDDILSLRGANIAIVAGGSRSASELLIANALQQRGLKIDDVTLTYLDEEEASRAIQKGDVDAVVAGEPALGRIARSAAENTGSLARIADSSRSPGLIADMLMGDERWLGDHKELVKRVIRAWDRVVRAQRRDPVAAAAAISEWLEIDPEQANQIIAESQLFDTSNNIEILRGEYQKAFSAMSTVWQRREQVGARGVPSANRFLDLAPLRQVARGR